MDKETEETLGVILNAMRQRLEAGLLPDVAFGRVSDEVLAEEAEEDLRRTGVCRYRKVMRVRRG